MEETGLVIDRVNALTEPSQAAEDTLMDGYAFALALESERVRLERRVEMLTRAVADDRRLERVPELRSLRERISSIEAELARLREALGSVRRRLLAAAESAA